LKCASLDSEESGSRSPPGQWEGQNEGGRRGGISQNHRMVGVGRDL